MKEAGHVWDAGGCGGGAASGPGRSGSLRGQARQRGCTHTHLCHHRLEEPGALPERHQEGCVGEQPPGAPAACLGQLPPRRCARLQQQQQEWVPPGQVRQQPAVQARAVSSASKLHHKPVCGPSCWPPQTSTEGTAAPAGACVPESQTGSGRLAGRQPGRPLVGQRPGGSCGRAAGPSACLHRARAVMATGTAGEGLG